MVEKQRHIIVIMIYYYYYDALVRRETIIIITMMQYTYLEKKKRKEKRSLFCKISASSSPERSLSSSMVCNLFVNSNKKLKAEKALNYMYIPVKNPYG